MWRRCSGRYVVGYQYIRAPECMPAASSVCLNSRREGCLHTKLPVLSVLVSSSRPLIQVDSFMYTIPQEQARATYVAWSHVPNLTSDPASARLREISSEVIFSQASRDNSLPLLSIAAAHALSSAL